MGTFEIPLKISSVTIHWKIWISYNSEILSALRCVTDHAGNHPGHRFQSSTPKPLGHEGTWTTQSVTYAWLVCYRYMKACMGFWNQAYSMTHLTIVVSYIKEAFSIFIQQDVTQGCIECACMNRSQARAVISGLVLSRQTPTDTVDCEQAVWVTVVVFVCLFVLYIVYGIWHSVKSHSCHGILNETPPSVNIPKFKMPLSWSSNRPRSLRLWQGCQWQKIIATWDTKSRLTRIVIRIYKIL